MDALNDYAGLISLVAAFAAIGAVVVPIIIYKKQRKDEVEAERRREEKERQKMQDELDSMDINSSPFSLYGYNRSNLARYKFLRKSLRRR